MAVDGYGHMTKTQHYRKITKPLLERKRRARMNLYLDELKSLIVDTMAENEEHANKLEKAEILEMTVNYLKMQQHQRAAEQTPGQLDLEKFRAGYTQAAYEVSKLFATLPGVDGKFGSRLLRQLGHSMKVFRSHEPRHFRQIDAHNIYSGTSHFAADQQPVTNESHSREPITSNTATVSAGTTASTNEATLGTENVWRPW